MSTIIRNRYPAADLPENLREGLPAGAKVRIIIEPEIPMPDKIISIEELFAMRKPPFLTTEEIVAEIRRERDAWE